MYQVVKWILVQSVKLKQDGEAWFVGLLPVIYLSGKADILLFWHTHNDIKDIWVFKKNPNTLISSYANLITIYFPLTLSTIFPKTAIQL